MVLEKLANSTVALAPSTNGRPLLRANVSVPFPPIAVTVDSPICTAYTFKVEDRTISTVPLAARPETGTSDPSTAATKIRFALLFFIGSFRTELQTRIDRPNYALARPQAPADRLPAIHDIHAVHDIHGLCGILSDAGNA